MGQSCTDKRGVGDSSHGRASLFFWLAGRRCDARSLVGRKTLPPHAKLAYLSRGLTNMGSKALKQELILAHTSVATGQRHLVLSNPKDIDWLSHQWSRRQVVWSLYSEKDLRRQ